MLNFIIFSKIHLSVNCPVCELGVGEPACGWTGCRWTGVSVNWVSVNCLVGEPAVGELSVGEPTRTPLFESIFVNIVQNKVVD